MKDNAPSVRCAVLGALAGGFVATMRAPVGASWLAPAVIDVERNVALRAMGALMAALLVGKGVQRVGARFCCLPTACGFVAVIEAVTLLGDRNWALHSVLASWALFFLASLAIPFALGPKSDANADSPRPSAISDGVCAVLAAFTVWRMRIASLDASWIAELPADSPDTHVGVAVMLGLLGAFAAAPLVASAVVRPRWVLLAWCATAATVFDGARIVGLFRVSDVLERFLSSSPWNLGLDALGTPAGDVLIAARVLIVSAICCGVALVLTARASGRTWIYFGLALGTFPPIVSTRNDDEVELTRAGRTCFTRFGRIEIEEGDGEQIVRVEHRRWTPTREEFALEQRLFEPLRGAKRVLVVGLITPQREAMLRELGVESMGCTAPFEEELADVIDTLYGTKRAESTVQVLSAQSAIDAVARDEFDAIWMPPIEGARMRFEMPRFSAGTKYLAWFESSAAIAEDPWPERIDVHVDHLERLLLGIGNGGELAGGSALAPQAVASRFSQSRAASARANTSRVASRLAGAASAEDAPLLRSLASHFEAQTASSPFETRAQKLELDISAMDQWRDAFSTRELGRFERSWVEGWALVLIGKRELEWIEAYIEPLASTHAPWAELERVLGLADIELLDIASASRWLERVLAEHPSDVEAALLRARCLLVLDDPQEAVRVLERARPHDPDRFELRRELAIARVRAGDPRGAVSVRELLREAPDDADLRAHGGPGPYPALTPITQ